MAAPPLIFRIAVLAPLPQLFDYLPPDGFKEENLSLGIRVRVPFGKREIVGVLIALARTSSLPIGQLKQVIEIIDSEPLFDHEIVKLLQFAADYYHHPLGEVYGAALPVLLRQGKPQAYGKKTTTSIPTLSTSNNISIVLNAEQQFAIDAITKSLDHFQVFLLDGITGSGKTEVYLQTVATVIQQNKQALILVPEIGLTPQLVGRFQQRFVENIVAIHSGLTDRERLNAWLLAKEGKAKIIIGTRSAVFTPLPMLGLIIIDEEHDLSFKQQEGFRYSARDLALIRAREKNIPVVLGSATPSLESLGNTRKNRYQHLQLSQRVGTAVQPKIRLLDLRNQRLEEGLSAQLIVTMQKHLADKGQILLFLNRRGFAPVLICHACGWIADCKRCDSKMTLHQHPPLLQCHHCGSQRSIEKTCPTCSNQQLMPLGLGTQRLEQTLIKHFPGVGIARIDRDSTRRKGNLETILESVHQGENQILIGTQMLAKGHHFPDVTLVVILNADNGLFSADFRANERMAQLLIQVAGRAGRAERPGEVIVQTYNPEHPLLQHLLQQDYKSFATFALAERSAAKLPPYAHLALLRAEATNKNYPLTFLTEVRELVQKFQVKTLDVLGPIPALIERKAGRFRAQLLLQAEQRSILHNLLKELLKKIESLPTVRRVRWSLDIDPLEIL